MIIIENIRSYRDIIEAKRESFKNLLIKTIKIGTYKVYSPTSDRWYDVCCGVTPSGDKFVNCNCVAGTYDRNCKHAMKSVDHHIMMKQNELKAVV